MFKSKMNLFGKGWIDTVFEGRNKQYGAYEMREKESKITVRAMIIGAIIFCLLVSAPLIVRTISNAMGRQVIDEQLTLVDLAQLPPPPKNEVAPPPPPPPKSIVEIKKFTPPVVGNENQVTEEMHTQEDLKNVKAGAVNVDASDEGVLDLGSRNSEITTGKAITEDKTIYTNANVQVQPEFPGGMAKFMEYIRSNLEGMQFDTQSGEVRMQFRFVVEKNGKLTDIQILDDGGFPEAAAKTVQVLKDCPAWSPAMIGGKPVRMAFILPVISKIYN